MGVRPGPLRLALIGLGVFLVVTVEVAILLWVAGAVGWWTLAIILGSAVLGVALLQREWRKAWAAISEATRAGQLPTGRLADATLIVIGGVLLILPGLLSDVLGLLLLLPFSRALVRSALSAWAARRVRRSGGEGIVIEGEVVAQEPSSGGTLIPEIDPRPHPEEAGPIISGEVDEPE